MNDGKITAAKLQACVALQLPARELLSTAVPPPPSLRNHDGQHIGHQLLISTGQQEHNAPPKYDWLIHAVSAVVSAPYTYMRIQWPDGHFLSNTPVDIWSMIQTGRNGRLFERPKFVEKNSVIRMDFGTSQTGDVVQVKVHFEGALRSFLHELPNRQYR